MTERHVIPHNRHRYLIKLYIYICIALQVHVSKGKNLSTCTIASRLCHLHVASTYECNSIPFYIFYKRFCGIPPGPFCLSNQINISQHQTLYSIQRYTKIYKNATQWLPSSLTLRQNLRHLYGFDPFHKLRSADRWFDTPKIDIHQSSKIFISDLKW